MNKINTYVLLLIGLIFCGTEMTAQWSISRFDHNNTFKHVVTVGANTAYVIGSPPSADQNFLLKTTDNGLIWDSLEINLAGENFQVYDMQFSSVTSGIIFGFKSSHQHMIKTTDGGQTWTEITPDATSGNPINAAYFVTDNIGFAACFGHLYKTSDGGITWSDSAVQVDITDISFINENIGFYCGSNQVDLMATMMKTTDGGQNWVEVLTDIATDLFISQFNNIDIVDANTIITQLDFTTHLYRSEDAGETWTMFEPQSEVNGIIQYDFTTANHGHLLTYQSEIWYTSDAGLTWTMEYAAEFGNYGPSLYLNDISIIGASGFVVGSNGVIKRYAFGTLGQNEIQTISNLEVFPNPLNSQENVTIALPTKGENFVLNIFNSSGQNVQSIKGVSNGKVVQINDFKFEPGCYHLLLQSENQLWTQQLIVIR